MFFTRTMAGIRFHGSSLKIVVLSFLEFFLDLLWAKTNENLKDLYIFYKASPFGYQFQLFALQICEKNEAVKTQCYKE